MTLIWDQSTKSCNPEAEESGCAGEKVDSDKKKNVREQGPSKKEACRGRYFQGKTMSEVGHVGG